MCALTAAHSRHRNFWVSLSIHTHFCGTRGKSGSKGEQLFTRQSPGKKFCFEWQCWCWEDASFRWLPRLSREEKMIATTNGWITSRKTDLKEEREGGGGRRMQEVYGKCEGNKGIGICSDGWGGSAENMEDTKGQRNQRMKDEWLVRKNEGNGGR